MKLNEAEMRMAYQIESTDPNAVLNEIYMTWRLSRNQATRDTAESLNHGGQPFNDNMLRPCPMLENPEKLRKMVKETGAKSTDLQSPESVDHLCDKCESYARNWAGMAEQLWSKSQNKTGQTVRKP